MNTTTCTASDVALDTISADECPACAGDGFLVDSDETMGTVQVGVCGCCGGLGVVAPRTVRAARGPVVAMLDGDIDF